MNQSNEVAAFHWPRVGRRLARCMSPVALECQHVNFEFVNCGSQNVNSVCTCSVQALDEQLTGLRH